MSDLSCPNCGKKQWMINSTEEQVFCNVCKDTFELTKVNVWYKKTILNSRNIEY